MLTALAVLMTVATAYGLVEAGLWLAGPSRLARGGVLAFAFLTGAFIPWAILDAVAGRDDDGDELA